MQLFRLILLLSLNTSFASADVRRISSIYKDLGTSQKIYLHAGLISVLEFPQSIVEVRLGNPRSLKAQLSQVSPKELTLYLNQQSVEPTNMIVKSEKRIYVFDIIPSRASHQDYIKISGAYGAPGLDSGVRPTLSEPLAPDLGSRPKARLIESVKVGDE